MAVKRCLLLALSACVLQMLALARAQKFGAAELVYEWNLLEFDWPSDAERAAAEQNQSYIPGRSLLAGIKLYKDDVFLTIPRWRWTQGHPVVLAKVVNKNGKNLLRPYPDWAAQKQGDCNALQYVQSMEIDPNTGLMYVIDTGRLAHSVDVCPPKIVVYDLKTDRQVNKYQFPNEVVNSSNCFLNDLVIDYVNGQARYVYITNTFEASIVVYDIEANSSYKISHPTMGLEGNNSENITINGISYIFPMPVNGIAVSADFKYVYYCSLAGYNLHQVPTSTLRNRSAGTNGIRTVGRKASQTDGLAHGKKRLYYGAIGLSAVYYWDVEKDLADQMVSEGSVNMKTQVELIRDNRTFEWPDTFAFDDKGYLWVITSRLQVYWTMDGLPATGDPFLRVWKIYVNETSYLYQADGKIQTGTTPGNGATTPAENATGPDNSGRTIFPLMIGAGASMFIIIFISIIAFLISRKL